MIYLKISKEDNTVNVESGYNLSVQMESSLIRFVATRSIFIIAMMKHI